MIFNIIKKKLLLPQFYAQNIMNKISTVNIFALNIQIVYTNCYIYYKINVIASEK